MVPSLETLSADSERASSRSSLLSHRGPLNSLLCVSNVCAIHNSTCDFYTPSDRCTLYTPCHRCSSTDPAGEAGRDHITQCITTQYPLNVSRFPPDLGPTSLTHGCNASSAVSVLNGVYNMSLEPSTFSATTSCLPSGQVDGGYYSSAGCVRCRPTGDTNIDWTC